MQCNSQRCAGKERLPGSPSLPGLGNMIPQAPTLGCSPRGPEETKAPRGDKSCLHALAQRDEPFGIRGRRGLAWDSPAPRWLPFALHPQPLCPPLLPQPLSVLHKVPTTLPSSRSSQELPALYLTVSPKPRTPPTTPCSFEPKKAPAPLSHPVALLPMKLPKGELPKGCSCFPHSP